MINGRMKFAYGSRSTSIARTRSICNEAVLRKLQLSPYRRSHILGKKKMPIGTYGPSGARVISRARSQLKKQCFFRALLTQLAYAQQASPNFRQKKGAYWHPFLKFGSPCGP